MVDNRPVWVSKAPFLKSSAHILTVLLSAAVIWPASVAIDGPSTEDWFLVSVRIFVDCTGNGREKREEFGERRGRRSRTYFNVITDKRPFGRLPDIVRLEIDWNEIL
jgi:hypothetical protein